MPGERKSKTYSKVFMETNFKRVDVKALKDNAFKLLDNDWMLITAGNRDSFNTMTASWGTLGFLWNKPIAIAFIRPQRFTYGFVKEAEFFTLSFFTEKYRDALNYIGNHSGRNVNKIADTGIVPVSTEHGNIYFAEARLVMECKKLYADNFKPENFVINSLIQKIYPTGDFHWFFIGEIIQCLSTDPLLQERGIKLEEDGNDLI